VTTLPAQRPAPAARSVRRSLLGSVLGLRRRRGRILAVKWGYNPNSSSLGVDITFLLLGLSVITLLTPIIGFLLRFQRARNPAT
jgi:hypothetical protein